MKARIEGKTLFIEIELEKSPAPSKTGKTIVIASTHGNVQTTAEVNGKPLTVGLNAYVKAM